MESSPSSIGMKLFIWGELLRYDFVTLYCNGIKNST